MKRWYFPLLALGCLSWVAGAAQGQDFPTKPITIVVSAAPGGVVDLLGRTVGQRLTKMWGQQVIVENKAGATNQIAAEYVAKSAPDGYTLLLTPEATFVINPSLFAKLAYDPVKDFVPVTGLVSINQALVLHPSVPAKNVKELIELAKQKPRQLNYGTFGAGSTAHLNMEMFQTMAGVKLVAVHYKGATPAFTDVIAGHIQMMFINMSSAVQPWKTGKINLLAVGSGKRLADFPEIPTIAESGLPGFQAVSWFGIFAPAGTPQAITARLNAQVQQIFADPEFRRTFIGPNMFEPITSSPQQFDAFIKNEARKWSKVIRDANVKLD